MFIVTYDRGDGSRSSYCVEPMTLCEAVCYLAKFVERYIGKPYPNGEGRYPFHSARIERH